MTPDQARAKARKLRATPSAEAAYYAADDLDALAAEIERLQAVVQDAGLTALVAPPPLTRRDLPEDAMGDYSAAGIPPHPDDLPKPEDP